jgi:hypothetical protein
MLGGRDLLGEPIEALHREGIRCPSYITIGWDALSAQNHPDWRAMLKDGHFADWKGHPLYLKISEMAASGIPAAYRVCDP